MSSISLNRQSFNSRPGMGDRQEPSVRVVDSGEVARLQHELVLSLGLR